MDENLKELLNVAPAGSDSAEIRFEIEVVNPAAGVIRLVSPSDAREFTLKPLRELYGQGNGDVVVDLRNAAFVPVFLAVEEEIFRFYAQNRSLTDGQVGLVLSQLGMDPGSATTDPLAVRIQMALRICLSLNNYSRQEVKSAIRKIVKSLELHTSTGGNRGYLQFLAKFLTQRRR